MRKQKKGEGRGLDAFEVALIKRMAQSGYPRDAIMSFIVRPGRKISPAAVHDVTSGRIGRDIEAATVQEAEQFMRKRVNEASQFTAGPTSPTIIREILRVGHGPQQSLPGFETSLIEYKREVPNTKDGRSKIAKTVASLANAEGGYIFFGVEDSRNIVGVPDDINLGKFWTDLSIVVTSYFAPAITWTPATVPVEGKEISVIYVSESRQKPIVSTGELCDIKKGVIYYRYPGISKAIEPGDLFTLLSQRDRIVLASKAL